MYEGYGCRDPTLQPITVLACSAVVSFELEPSLSRGNANEEPQRSNDRRRKMLTRGYGRRGQSRNHRSGRLLKTKKEAIQIGTEGMNSAETEIMEVFINKSTKGGPRKV